MFIIIIFFFYYYLSTYKFNYNNIILNLLENIYNIDLNVYILAFFFFINLIYFNNFNYFFKFIFFYFCFYFCFLIFFNEYNSVYCLNCFNNKIINSNLLNGLFNYHPLLMYYFYTFSFIFLFSIFLLYKNNKYLYHYINILNSFKYKNFLKILFFLIFLSLILGC